jgi:cation diffusion facilitator CzcD-associated flavoprotein CzcO
MARRLRIIMIGGGIGGLAAARALRLRGQRR